MVETRVRIDAEMMNGVLDPINDAGDKLVVMISKRQSRPSNTLDILVDCLGMLIPVRIAFLHMIDTNHIADTTLVNILNNLVETHASIPYDEYDEVELVAIRDLLDRSISRLNVILHTVVGATGDKTYK